MNRLSELFSEEDDQPQPRRLMEYRPRRIPPIRRRNDWTGKIVLLVIFLLPSIAFLFLLWYLLADRW